jgi:hypothetical protein
VNQVEVRLANEKYLRDHPEIDRMLSDFVDTVLSERPTDILPFAVSYFTSDDLASKLK